jgi:hypothetical protein
MEMRVWDAIKKRLPEPSSRDNVLTGASCGEKVRRADVSWVASDRVVFLEIDEYSHSGRLVPCELAKLVDTKWGLARDLQCKFTVFVRLNPNTQRGSAASFDTRCEDAVDAVNGWIHRDISELNPRKPHVEFLHYGDAGMKHVEAARESDSIVVVSALL